MSSFMRSVVPDTYERNVRIGLSCSAQRSTVAGPPENLGSDGMGFILIPVGPAYSFFWEALRSRAAHA